MTNNTSLNNDSDKNADMNGGNKADDIDDFAAAQPSLNTDVYADTIDNSIDATKETARSVYAGTDSVFKQNGRCRRGSSIF